MFAEALISFRESLEAALVVGIVLAYLEQTGNTKYNRHIYLGVFAGILASLIGGLALYSIGSDFEGASAKLFEGSMMIIGSVLVSWMILWMLRQAHVKREIEVRVSREISRGYAQGLFFFVFISVFREGIETVIFLSASFFSVQAFSVLGVLIGFAAAVLLALLIFEAAVRVDLKTFFNATSILLIFFAAGLFSHGIAEFQEGGFLPEQGPVWDSSWLVSEGSTAGIALKSLFGYAPTPTPLQVFAYLFYWVLIGAAYRNIGRIHKII